MIGHGHIDAAWLWPWWEGMQEVWSTFRSALDRMEEHPEVCFVASSAAYYEWIERLDPGMLDEIRRRVEEGRWELVGGWWIEPDCNIPGGEALVRQALHGQRYFLSRFGRAATIGFNVDSFGHPGSFPQLLRGAGLRRYVFLRPGPHEQELPGRVFHWESADGSSVLAFRVCNSYNSGPDDIEEELAQNRAEIRPPHRGMACFFGIGNHGGGPTRANLGAIDQLRHRWPDTSVEYGTLERFFEEAEGEGPRPAHRGELQHHASGCYAAHSGIKRWNRRAEQMLLAAERAQVLASRLNAARPADLGGAWRALLFNQFHDILAGTSLASVYDSARDGMGEAAAIAERELWASLQAVAARIDIPAVEGSTRSSSSNPTASPWTPSSSWRRAGGRRWARSRTKRVRWRRCRRCGRRRPPAAGTGSPSGPASRRWATASSGPGPGPLPSRRRAAGARCSRTTSCASRWTPAPAWCPTCSTAAVATRC
jgi:alpha-mannosidase